MQGSVSNEFIFYWSSPSRASAGRIKSMGSGWRRGLHVTSTATSHSQDWSRQPIPDTRYCTDFCPYFPCHPHSTRETSHPHLPRPFKPQSTPHDTRDLNESTCKMYGQVLVSFIPTYEWSKGSKDGYLPQPKTPPSTIQYRTIPCSINLP